MRPLSQQDMAGSMLELISPSRRHIAEQLVPKGGALFEMRYGLNCERLCQDFQEDISFKFSLGVLNMIKTFTATRTTPPALGSPNASPQPLTPEVGDGCLDVAACL